MERREEIGGAKGGDCLYAHLARRDVESLEGHGCIQTHSSYQERALSRLFQCKTAVLTNARDVTRTCAYPSRVRTRTENCGRGFENMRTC